MSCAHTELFIRYRGYNLRNMPCKDCGQRIFYEVPPPGSFSSVVGETKNVTPYWSTSIPIPERFVGKPVDKECQAWFRENLGVEIPIFPSRIVH